MSNNGVTVEAVEREITATQLEERKQTNNNKVGGMKKQHNGSTQERFTDVLAQLAMHKDDCGTFVKQHQSKYRWVWQYEKDMVEDGEACSARKYQETIQKVMHEDEKGCLFCLLDGNGCYSYKQQAGGGTGCTYNNPTGVVVILVCLLEGTSQKAV